MDSIFQKGASTGNKADPKDVSREMRHLKGPNGERHFMSKEFLTEQQKSPATFLECLIKGDLRLTRNPLNLLDMSVQWKN